VHDIKHDDYRLIARPSFGTAIIFSNFMQYERLHGAERQSKMTPFAPILRYRGRREELKGLVKSLISNVVDVRDPIQIAYDQLAKRAEAVLV
jgi:hypothetical protein